VVVRKFEKLPDYLREAIEDSGNPVFISAAAVWEIVIKKKLGKLISPDNLSEGLEENDLTSISITLDHIFSLEKLPAIHNDPSIGFKSLRRYGII